MTFLRRIWEEEAGASALEYCLMAALIAVVIVTGVTALGQNLSSKFSSMATQLGS